MKNQRILGQFLFIVGLLSISVFQAIAQNETVDKTESPYFFVKSDNPAEDQLPLKSTKAKVNITGVIADVTVTQVYKNEGKNPLELKKWCHFYVHIFFFDSQ